MDTNEIKQLVVKLAALADRLDARSESAVHRVERSGDALDQRAQWLGSSADSFTRASLQAIETQAGEVIGRGVGRAVEQCNGKLQDTAQTAASVGRELEQVRMALQRERRTWLWLGSGALLVGSVLAITAAFFAVKTSKEQVQRNRIEAALLRAYNEADVTLCDGRLCANIDEAGKRQGDRKQYRPVMPR